MQLVFILLYVLYLQWFWEILEELSEQEKVLMLQFATGRYSWCSCFLVQVNVKHLNYGKILLSCL